MRPAAPCINPASYSGTVALEIARISKRGGDKSVWMEIDRWTQGGDGLPNGCRFKEWAAVVDKAAANLLVDVVGMIDAGTAQKTIDSASDHQVNLQELNRALEYLADIERRVKAFAG